MTRHPRGIGRDLREQVSSLSSGFQIVRIDASTVAAFRALDDAFIYNFSSNAVFRRDGVGFGVLHDGQFVAGCSSFTIGGGKLEFEIETHRDFRERDLATAVGARMVLYCLGFVNPQPYRSFYLV